MIEAALYFALGALCVSLLLFVILPIVSGRARRLAIHELERQAPVSLSEITAQKDQMRARFAVELNRQEKRADQLQVESQQHLVTAEKWRIFAERVEQEFEKLKNEYTGLKKNLSSAEVNLEKQKEIAKSALKTMTGQDKKRLFELEDEVEELRAEKTAANIHMVAIQTELNNSQSRVAEMERHMPSLEELSLRKELKALAEDVSAFVKSTPPPPPAAIVPPAPIAAKPPVAPEPKNTGVEPTESKPRQPAPEKRHEETAAAMSVIPAFLKPAAERQTVAPEPVETQREVATDASPELEPYRSNVAKFPVERALTTDHAKQQQHTVSTQSEPTPQVNSTASLQMETVVAAEQPPIQPPEQSAIQAAPQSAGSIADSIPGNGDEHLESGSKKANVSDPAAEKPAEGPTYAPVVSAKRVKQDKPSKFKKSGFAGLIAAVSRSNKSPASSAANGKVKSGPVQYNGKLSLKHNGSKSAAIDGTELNGAGSDNAASGSTQVSPKDSVATATNRKKIVKFGKKARRIKAASASS
ncbi:MAG: hypothetical protein V7703_02070 [Hyphomicrobiales bacterium]